MSKKGETFNQLDERFQLQAHHDPNHIFPEEYEMIKELRKRRPELEKESDKFLCVFLFARRHNIDETIVLLDSYLAKRKELGFDVNPPNPLKSDTLRKHLESGVIMKVKGGLDKHERILHYVWIAKDKPKERHINVLYEYGFWETHYQLQTESLKTWRNGSCLVIDFKGFGLNNVDLSPKGIEFSKALSGVFPKRIRKVFVLNGGWLLKLISEAAKLVLNKKLSERLEISNVEGLRNLVPVEWLMADYGGKCNMSVKEWVQEVLRDEEKWEKASKNLEKSPQLKSFDHKVPFLQQSVELAAES